MEAAKKEEMGGLMGFLQGNRERERPRGRGGRNVGRGHSSASAESDWEDESSADVPELYPLQGLEEGAADQTP